jgi:hypothetical protein
MNQQDYHYSITANITAKEAFENISHVPEWWATNFEGNSEKLNNIFTVCFGETFVTFKIIEVVPEKRIVWQVIDCYLHWLKDKKEWKDSKISWDISTKNNLTQIAMTHIGLVPEIACYNECKKGWDFFVGESLLKLLTEHKGLPDTSKSNR